jgi:hypothetical protein
MCLMRVGIGVDNCSFGLKSSDGKGDMNVMVMHVVKLRGAVICPRPVRNLANYATWISYL